MVRMLPAPVEYFSQPVVIDKQLMRATDEYTARFLRYIIQYFRHKPDIRVPLVVVIHRPGVAVGAAGRAFTFYGVPRYISPLNLRHRLPHAAV